MKKKLILIMVFSLLLSLISISTIPSVSFACKCAYLPSVEKGFDQAKAVFSGEVVKVEEQENKKGYMEKRVLFEVEQTWKGKSQSQLIVTTGLGGGDCGFDFQLGEKYLVYARTSPMYGDVDDLVTIICDRTRKFEKAEEDLAYLGDGKEPVKEVHLEDELVRGNNMSWILFIATIIGVASVLVLKRKRKNR